MRQGRVSKIHEAVSDFIQLLSPPAFYACRPEPEPCLASPLPLRSDSGVEPQSEGDALSWQTARSECERSERSER